MTAPAETVTEAFWQIFDGLLEEAVREAQKPAEPTRATALSASHPDVWCVLFATQTAYDWAFVGWERDAGCERTIVRVKLKCGHTGRFFINEREVALKSIPEIGNYLLDTMATGPTARCGCGTPSGLGPAGGAR